MSPDGMESISGFMADTSEKRPDAMLMRMSHVTHYKVLPILRLEDLNRSTLFHNLHGFFIQLGRDISPSQNKIHWQETIFKI